MVGVWFLKHCVIIFGFVFFSTACSRTSLPTASPAHCPSTHDFPSVVRVWGAGQCTGIAINRRAVLTASHCTAKGLPTLVQQGESWIDSRRTETLGSPHDRDFSDVALLIFDHALAIEETELFPIGNVVSAGDEVRLVGFGCAGRRTGTNIVTRAGVYLELPFSDLPEASPSRWLKGPENRVETCQGDSGAPALRQTGGRNYLVGIHHAEVFSGRKRWAELTNLTHSENRSLLKQIANRYELTIEGL